MIYIVTKIVHSPEETVGRLEKKKKRLENKNNV